MNTNNREKLKALFSRTPLGTDADERIERVCQEAFRLAIAVADLTPQGPHQYRAIESAHEVIMHTEAALRHGPQAAWPQMEKRERKRVQGSIVCFFDGSEWHNAIVERWWGPEVATVAYVVSGLTGDGVRLAAQIPHQSKAKVGAPFWKWTNEVQLPGVAPIDVTEAQTKAP